MRLLLIAFGLLPAYFAFAQPVTPGATVPDKEKYKRYYELPDPVPFGKTIQSADLKVLLNKLASAEMQGRETGEEGQRRAAKYIAEQFKNLGLPPVGDKNNYEQDILLVKEGWKNIGITVEGKDFKNRTDFYVFPSFNPNQPSLSLKDVVFIGYGIEDPAYNDYGKTDVEGKAVIFYDGEPSDKDGKSVITGKELRSPWTMDWKRKVQLAKKKGALMVFIIDTKFEESMKNNRKLTSTYGWKPMDANMEKKAKEYINSVFISPAMAKAILGDKGDKANLAMESLREGDKFKPVKIKAKMDIRLEKDRQDLRGSNVVGFIEGSDPVLKKEYVFITAHYDHLGMSDSTVIYHGADDNGSGTSGVIEIARAFAEAKKQGVGPKRSVVCMLVSGEEKGLLGSQFYVEFPMYPLDKTVVDINIDMIGRIDDLHPKNGNYIYVIGSDRLSSELHNINEDANERYTKLELDYKYNAKDDPNHFYERSDHYNFAERGIPAIFFFNGTHADYHRPTDTVEKIDFDALAKRAQLAFYTAWDIANRPSKLVVDGKN